MNGGHVCFAVAGICVKFFDCSMGLIVRTSIKRESYENLMNKSSKLQEFPSFKIDLAIPNQYPSVRSTSFGTGFSSSMLFNIFDR